jgi:hypothetical protein
MSEGCPRGLGRLSEGSLRPGLAYHMARTRAGPPDAPFTLGKPTKIVAPRAGIFPRFTRFSSPHLLAGKILALPIRDFSEHGCAFHAHAP